MVIHPKHWATLMYIITFSRTYETLENFVLMAKLVHKREGDQPLSSWPFYQDGEHSRCSASSTRAESVLSTKDLGEWQEPLTDVWLITVESCDIRE